jgi:hypothetical protein
MHYIAILVNYGCRNDIKYKPQYFKHLYSRNLRLGVKECTVHLPGSVEDYKLAYVTYIYGRKLRL